MVEELSPVGDVVKKPKRTTTGVGIMFIDGRIPVYVLHENQNDALVDEKFIFSETDSLQERTLPENPTIEELTAYQNQLIAVTIQTFGKLLSIKESSSTKIFLETVGHEKIHGLQDEDLPKPIKEAQAAFFEREILKHFGHELIGSPLLAAAEFYAALVQQYGQNVHRVLFGTAPKHITEELRPKILKAFEDNMDRIFPNVVWETIDAAEIQ